MSFNSAVPIISQTSSLSCNKHGSALEFGPHFDPDFETRCYRRTQGLQDSKDKSQMGSRLIVLLTLRLVYLSHDLICNVWAKRQQQQIEGLHTLHVLREALSGRHATDFPTSTAKSGSCELLADAD